MFVNEFKIVEEDVSHLRKYFNYFNRRLNIQNNKVNYYRSLIWFQENIIAMLFICNPMILLSFLDNKYFNIIFYIYCAIFNILVVISIIKAIIMSKSKNKRILKDVDKDKQETTFSITI